MSQLKLVYDHTAPGDIKHRRKLTNDMYKILDVLRDGQAWHYIAVADKLGIEPASVQSNIRNLRQKKHGQYNIKLIKLGKINCYKLEDGKYEVRKPNLKKAARAIINYMIENEMAFVSLEDLEKL